MKTIKLIVIINIFFSSFISIFAAGYTCTISPGNCDPGYKPLNEAGITFHGLNSFDLKRSIINTIDRGALTSFGSYRLTDKNRLCIKDSVSTVISVLYSNIGLANSNAESANEGYNLVGYYSDSAFVNVPSSCFGNSTVSQRPTPNVSSVSAGIYQQTAEENIYGCCPVGYNFVLRESLKDTELSLFDLKQGTTPLGACCPNISETSSGSLRDSPALQNSPQGYPVKFRWQNGPKCFSKNNNQYEEIQYSSDTPIYYDKYRIHGSDDYQLYVDVVSKIASNVEETIGQEVYDMVFGIPMGTASQIVKDAKLNNLDPLFCNNAGEGACGIIGPDLPGGVFSCKGGGIDSCRLSDGQFVIDAGTFIDNEDVKIFTCKKCYQQGEIIETVANNSSGIGGYVGFCEDGTLAKKDLINGSITDTVEYYLTDPTNQPLLAQCKASGGIYTAVGCVDPTPIGLITGLIRIALGVIGGVALLQLIYVGIQYQLGDEAKIKEARSRLIATITGVAVLVFSILILRIIGVNVLDILPAGSI